MNKKLRLFLIIFSALGLLVFLTRKFIIYGSDNEYANQNPADEKPQLIRKNDGNPQQMDSKDVQEYMDLAKKIFADKTDKENFQRDGVAFKVRVVDQYGKPVVGATYGITYSKGFDTQQHLHGPYGQKTDENGIFDVKIDQKITSLWVSAVKVGYYQLPGKSDKAISMTKAQNLTKNLTMDEKDRWEKIQDKISATYNTLEKLLDEQGVVTLTLKKMSNYDKMYQNMFSFSATSNDPDEKLPGKYLMEYEKNKSDGIIPEDANVIDIGPGFYDKSKEQKLKIRYTHNNQYVEMMAAPWYCEMRIPGGGFYLIDEKIEPDGDVYQSEYAANAKEGEEFMAPENGYQETVRAEMPESTLKDGTWRDYYLRNYYVKFPDNTYGRIRVSLGYGQYYQITSWYNPTGRRNTEFCLEDDLDVIYIEKKR